MSAKDSKPVILCYVSSGELLSRSGRALNKMNEVIDIFAAAKDDINVMWYHDPRLDSYLESDASEIFDKYKALIRRFEESGCGVYCSSLEEEDNLVARCTAYYGSGGYLATGCVDAGKPVMIWEVSGN